jgi:hypothetical protein
LNNPECQLWKKQAKIELGRRRRPTINDLIFFCLLQKSVIAPKTACPVHWRKQSTSLRFLSTGFTWLFFALIGVTAFLMLFRGNEYFVTKNIKTLNKR